MRKTHLEKQGRKDTETSTLLEKIDDLEKYVDERIANLLQEHPAYNWFSRIKGVGRENIGKVVGLIDIKKAPMISSLWKFAGYHVENGRAPKREKGVKLSYNSQLRSMSWRLGGSLLKAGDKFYDYYCKEKQNYQTKFTNSGIKIVPTSQLPKGKNGRYESEEIISEGHLHNMALRKMIKLFLSCLWMVWREAEGLPTRDPYPVEKLGHIHIISPWEMVAIKKKR